MSEKYFLNLSFCLPMHIIFFEDISLNSEIKWTIPWSIIWLILSIEFNIDTILNCSISVAIAQVMANISLTLELFIVKRKIASILLVGI